MQKSKKFGKRFYKITSKKLLLFKLSQNAIQLLTKITFRNQNQFCINYFFKIQAKRALIILLQHFLSNNNYYDYDAFKKDNWTSKSQHVVVFLSFQFGMQVLVSRDLGWLTAGKTLMIVGITPGPHPPHRSRTTQCTIYSIITFNSRNI